MTFPTTRRLAAAGSLALFLGLASACGGGEGSTADAKDDAVSTKAFCKAFDSEPETPADPTDKAAMEKSWEAWVETLSAGTPEGIPDEAREGYEIYLDKMGSVDWSKPLEQVQEDFGKLEDSLSAEEKKKTEAFDAYEKKTCDA